MGYKGIRRMGLRGFHCLITTYISCQLILEKSLKIRGIGEFKISLDFLVALEVPYKLSSTILETMETIILWLKYNYALQSYVSIFSLICLFLTLTVYLYVNKLRNHLGMCLVFLLFCRLVCGLYFHFTLYEKAAELGFCRAAGYTTYFFLNASELWSIAFSHILWKGLKAPIRNDSGNRFLAYNIFAWGTAASLTTVMYLLDYYFESDQYLNLLPGVGRYDCWLDIRSGLAFTIYIKFPSWVTDSYTVIVFALTAFHILKVKREIRKFNRNDDRRTKLKSDKKNFLMLLRLFSIMAMDWSFTILDQITEGDIKMMVEVVTIYYHLSFGILIFALFIMKRSTLRLLLERILNL